MASRRTSKDFPGFSRVYQVTSGGTTRSYIGDIDLPRDDQFALVRGELVPKEPVEVRWGHGGKQAKDVIWATVAAPVIVSTRVVDVLTSNGFTGWSNYPVKVYSKDGDKLPGYVGLSIRGRCGPIDDRLSQRVPKNYPGGEFPVLKGMYFDPATWDGSDVFTVKGRASFIFVLEPVRAALTAAKIKNVKFQALDEVERMLP